MEKRIQKLNEKELEKVAGGSKEAIPVLCIYGLGIASILAITGAGFVVINKLRKSWTEIMNKLNKTIETLSNQQQ